MKTNEETLTYLNQGQPYEIKLKKLGDLTHSRGKIFKVGYSFCHYFQSSICVIDFYRDETSWYILNIVYIYIYICISLKVSSVGEESIIFILRKFIIQKSYYVFGIKLQFFLCFCRALFVYCFMTVVFNTWKGSR